MVAMDKRSEGGFLDGACSQDSGVPAQAGHARAARARRAWRSGVDPVHRRNA